MYQDQLLCTLEQSAKAAVRVIGWDSRPDGTCAPLKSRNCAVLHYVLRGCGWFDGEKIGAGQGFYFPADEPHCYHACEEDPWEYVFLDMGQAFADQIAVPAIHADARGIFSFSFREWLQKWAEKHLSSAPMTFISETEAVYQATSILRRHETEKIEADDKQLLYVKKAQIFIEKNLKRRLLVSDVAKAVNLNQRYLCALFVQYTGGGVKEYIIGQKMQAALELLAETSLSIKEISLEVGISDPNSFSKLFRAETGVSPSEFRERLQKGTV